MDSTKELLTALADENQAIAQNLPVALNKLAGDDPSVSAYLPAVTRKALERQAASIKTYKYLMEVLPKILVHNPSVAEECFESLVRLSQHKGDIIRATAIDCLGYLALVDSIDTQFVVEHLVTKLQQPHDTRHVLASLTTIGLKYPDLLTPWRDRIAESLTFRPTRYQGPTHSIYRRRNATAALAVNALGESDPMVRPPRDQLYEDMSATTAWVIQKSVREDGLETPTDREIPEAGLNSHDRGLFEQVLTNLLRRFPDSLSGRTRIAALVAIGCLAPWQEGFQASIAQINDAVDSYETDALDAASDYVCRNGPFTPDTYGTGPVPDTEVALDVLPAQHPDVHQKSRTPSGYGRVVLSSETEREFFDDYPSADKGATFELEGSETCLAQRVVGQVNSGQVLIKDHLMDRLGVERGDTVTVRPVQTVIAQRLVVSTPPGKPIEPNLLTTTEVHRDLSKQAYTAGDTISLPVVVDESAFADNYDYNAEEPSRKAIKQATRELPLRVERCWPADANTITRNTEIIIDDTSDFSPNLAWRQELDGEAEPFVPLSLFSKRLQHNDPSIGQVSTDGDSEPSLVPSEDATESSSRHPGPEQLKKMAQKCAKWSNTVGADSSEDLKSGEKLGLEEFSELLQEKREERSIPLPQEQEEFDQVETVKRILRKNDGEIPEDAPELVKEHLTKMREEMGEY